MKILIIGCNGFIGSNALKYFKEKKYTVIGSDIKIGASEMSSEINNSIKLADLFQSERFDVCINASGSSTVAFSLQNEQEDYLLNYKNVELLVNAIKVHQPQCKLINLSSAAVYGNPSVLPINEDSATKPISPYGKHKLLSEQLLLECAKNDGLATLSLRIFSVYGNGLKKQLFWDMYQKSLTGNLIELYGTGHETRDFIHIDDLMFALEQIILHASFDGSTINVASGIESTIKSAASTFVTYLNPKLIINFNDFQNNIDPRHWKADISRLKTLGFTPKISLEEGLKKYASWLKKLN
jgi:dTDP-glucose 4,6-dehydratase/UDP-glucose 4-epimerase